MPVFSGLRELPAEAGHQLHVGGMPELIDRRDLTQSEAAAEENPGIAGEGGGVAGHGDHVGQSACRELAALRALLTAPPWRATSLTVLSFRISDSRAIVEY